MFNIILGLPWLLVVVRFIEPLPWPWSIKLLLAAVLLIASQFLLFCRLSSGSVFSPEFPRPIIIAFNVLFGATVLLAVFQIGLDLVSIVLWPIKGAFPVIWPEFRYGMGIVALCLAMFGLSQAICVPALRDIEIPVSGLPAAFDGYRLLQLTDLHISRLFPGRWAEAVVSKANALDVDLIVMTGTLSTAMSSTDVSMSSRSRNCGRGTVSGPFPATTSTSSTIRNGCANTGCWDFSHF